MKIGKFELLAWLAGIGLALGAADTGTTWTFEKDEPGTLPRGFTAESGRWEVVAVPGGRALAQKAENPDPTFNLALAAGLSAKDVDLSARLKAVAGKLDQGGGVVWRAKDAKNYYLVRYNPLEDNIRVYKVVDGKRTLFQDAKAPPGDGWREVRAVMKGDHIECYLDGKKFLDVHDSTFVDRGRVGLWSKSDAQSYFDDLTLKLVSE